MQFTRIEKRLVVSLPVHTRYRSRYTVNACVVEYVTLCCALSLYSRHYQSLL